MRDLLKKTPADATEFEREQLRFLLTEGDVASTLVELNPSLAWLPVLAEMKLIKNDTQLGPWIERNFHDAEAVREVAANIRFFGPDTADFIEVRLNRTSTLPPLLHKCWRLIIRHMRTVKRGVVRNDWFDVAPQIKRGGQSPALLERLAQILRPKLKISKYLSWHDERDSEPKVPSDLMSIDYEVEDGVVGEEVLSIWPENAAAEADKRLLILLTQALIGALEDAVDAEVENSRGFGVSDRDVPSVSDHPQNAHHSGFLPIVRVTADVWTRLTRKDPRVAIQVLELWRTSPLRLLRRLALFAAADTAVSADAAADILLSLPQHELFLTGSSVEIRRLIRSRWSDLTTEQRKVIEDRLADGPLADSFREDTEKERLIDRCRFDMLADIQRMGFTLSEQAEAVLNGIRNRWPQWELRPEAQAGFHIWSEGGTFVAGDPQKLRDVSDEELIATAKRVADQRQILEGDPWDALCQNEPIRALRGLEATAGTGQWPNWAWEKFLWAAQKLEDADAIARTAQLLLNSPADQFQAISDTASWWLNQKSKSLSDNLLWPLWDRIEAAAPRDTQEPTIQDALTSALNAPPGHLAEILLKTLPNDEIEHELRPKTRDRFDKVVNAKGQFGKLGRVRLAAEVSLLFERAPMWTEQRIIPLFDWSSPEAGDMWAARMYSNYIGSPKLFELTKRSFLELFSRTDISDEEIRTFADWLVVIMLANRSDNAGYPITPIEGRSALRGAGIRSLSSVGHRLAVEMEKTKPDEKVSKWRNLIGPVFESIWPLDVDLQSAASTFKLVQILLAAGEAFPEAADAIIPFIRSGDPHQTTMFSISESDDGLYSSFPEKMLELLSAVADDARGIGVYGLHKALERIKGRAPHLEKSRKFQKLLALAVKD